MPNLRKDSPRGDCRSTPLGKPLLRRSRRVQRLGPPRPPGMVKPPVCPPPWGPPGGFTADSRRLSTHIAASAASDSFTVLAQTRGLSEGHQAGSLICPDTSDGSSPVEPWSRRSAVPPVAMAPNLDGRGRSSRRGHAWHRRAAPTSVAPRQPVAIEANEIHQFLFPYRVESARRGHWIGGLVSLVALALRVFAQPGRPPSWPIATRRPPAQAETGGRAVRRCPRRGSAGLGGRRTGSTVLRESKVSQSFPGRV